MKPRTLVILAIAVGALAAFIWFYERELPSSERRAELGKRVLALEAEDIHGISIEAGGKRVRLERDPVMAPASANAAVSNNNRQWRLVEPLGGPADRAAADRLADTLAALEKLRTLENADRKD